MPIIALACRLLCCALLLILAVGCAEKEEPLPEVEVPPPPTPEEIKQQIMTDTKLNQPPPNPGAKLPAGAGQAFLNQMKGIYNQHSQTPEGKEALKLVAKDIEARIVALEERELWDFVVVMCDVNDVYNPGSTRFNRTRERAIIELKKPKVTVKGIFTDEGGRTTAMLDFYMPLTSETHPVKLRVGEQSDGMRFERIIGNNRGVVMKYLETGEEQQILTNQ